MIEAPHVLTLDQIRVRVKRLADKLEASPQLLPTYGHSADFARPHIEVDGSYHFVVVERGQEFERRTTPDVDTLLYWIFSGITFQMASDFELKHRATGTDCRRLIFKKQLDLLAELDPAWRVRCKAEIRSILSKYPFSDNGPTQIE